MITAIEGVQTARRKTVEARQETPGYRNREIHVAGETVYTFSKVTGFDLGPDRTSKFLRVRLESQAEVGETPPAWYRRAGLPEAERYAVIGESWVFCLDWNKEAWQTAGFACLEQLDGLCEDEGRCRPASWRRHEDGAAQCGRVRISR